MIRVDRIARYRAGVHRADWQDAESLELLTGYEIMHRLTCFSAIFILSTTWMGFSLADAPEGTTIKTIMNGAHKAPPKGTGLLKKVATGKANAEETKDLLDLYKAMAKLAPPKGETDAWTERTGLLVGAVENIIKGEDEGKQQLQKASNCKACHDAHKE